MNKLPHFPCDAHVSRSTIALQLHQLPMEVLWVKAFHLFLSGHCHKGWSSMPCPIISVWPRLSLNEIIARLRALRQEQEVRVSVISEGSQPRLVVDTTVLQAFISVMNNAADRKPTGYGVGRYVEGTPLSVRGLEWEQIEPVLKEHNGNISAAARSLNMHRRTLQRKLAKYSVKRWVRWDCSNRQGNG